jgi:hypothetical protein
MPSAKKCIELTEKRVDANDANAIFQLGSMYLDGNEEFNRKKM